MRLQAETLQHAAADSTGRRQASRARNALMAFEVIRSHWFAEISPVAAGPEIIHEARFAQHLLESRICAPAARIGDQPEGRGVSTHIDDTPPQRSHRQIPITQSHRPVGNDQTRKDSLVGRIVQSLAQHGTRIVKALDAVDHRLSSVMGRFLSCMMARNCDNRFRGSGFDPMRSTGPWRSHRIRCGRRRVALLRSYSACGFRGMTGRSLQRPCSPAEQRKRDRVPCARALELDGIISSSRPVSTRKPPHRCSSGCARSDLTRAARRATCVGPSLIKANALSPGRCPAPWTTMRAPPPLPGACQRRVPADHTCMDPNACARCSQPRTKAGSSITASRLSSTAWVADSL